MLLRIAVIVLSLSCVAEGWPSPATNNASVPTEQYASGNVTQGYSPVNCRPTTWFDIILFYFTNYVIHALSVRSIPGEDTVSSTAFRFLCLLIPYTGVRRGLSLVLRASNLAPNELQAAARARALCMVIRSKDWRPRDGDVLNGCSVELGGGHIHEENANEGNGIELCQQSSTESGDSIAEKAKSEGCATVSRVDNPTAILSVKSAYTALPPPTITAKMAKYTVQTITPKFDVTENRTIDQKWVKLHGFCKLAPEYEICYIPSDMKVYPRLPSQLVSSASQTDSGYLTLSKKTHLASSHAIPRTLFSLAQTVSGGYQLYKVRGAQIAQFGFAAYGLTVLPYVIVSIINVMGSLLTKEYTSLYLVHSEIMDEMIRRGGIVDGAVGTISVPREASEETDHIPEETQSQTAGTSFIFETSPSALHCRTIGSPSSTQEFIIRDPEPVATIPKVPFKVRFRESMRRIFKRRSRAGDIEPTAPLPTTIIVPSHPTFVRLPRPYFQPALEHLAIILLLISVVLPYLLIYILTGFRRNNATTLQIQYAILWLIAGQLHGYFGNSDKLISRRKALWAFLLVFTSYGSYCVGGFVIVAEELVQTGVCSAQSIWAPV